MYREGRARETRSERNQSRATPSAPTNATKRASKSSRLRHRTISLFLSLSLSVKHFHFCIREPVDWLRCCTLFLWQPTMVVLVDLEDDEAPSFQQAAPHASGLLNVKPLHHSLMNNAAATSTTAVERSEQSVEATEQRPNPNMNGFSAALSCYP